MTYPNVTKPSRLKHNKKRKKNVTIRMVPYIIFFKIFWHWRWRFVYWPLHSQSAKILAIEGAQRQELPHLIAVNDMNGNVTEEPSVKQASISSSFNHICLLFTVSAWTRPHTTTLCVSFAGFIPSEWNYGSFWFTRGWRRQFCRAYCKIANTFYWFAGIA